MILYHFCAAHMMPAIMREGLTLGKYPILGASFALWPKTQWLTKDPDPRRQSWATRALVPYSRLAYRLTVQIPESYRKKLVKASDYAKRLPEEDRALVSKWAGSENWYVYLANIPPKWIVGCTRMDPALAASKNIESKPVNDLYDEDGDLIGE